MKERQARSSGFSLVELSAALAVTLVIGVAVMGLVDVSQSGARTVSTETHSSRALRSAAEHVAGDLRQTAQPQLSITTLPDQNHTVTLQVPVGVSGGVVTWGVYDPVLGTDPASRTKAGWSLRYTVRTVLLDGVGLDRQLVRQILNTGGQVRHERVLLRHVEEGYAAQPGFRVEQNGAMWRVTISARTGTGTGPVHSLAFDVALRNE